MADGMTLVAVGGPWLLGTCVAVGTLGMVVTAGMEALWRRLAGTRKTVDEPAPEPELAVEDPDVPALATLAGPGARLRAVCLAAGMPEAAVEELLARHLASARHPSRTGGRGGSEVAVTQELPVLRLLPSPDDEVTQEIPTVSAEVARG